MLNILCLWQQCQAKQPYWYAIIVALILRVDMSSPAISSQIMRRHLNILVILLVDVSRASGGI